VRPGQLTDADLAQTPLGDRRQGLLRCRCRGRKRRMRGTLVRPPTQAPRYIYYTRMRWVRHPSHSRDGSGNPARRGQVR